MSSKQNSVQERSALYCPHFENVDERTLEQLFSKVAAIRSEDRELFDFTHRPIEVFRSPQGTQEEEEVVGEEDVYRQFSDDGSGNFAVVIEGEVGTGKSELCAYLAHRLEHDDSRPILHIDKNDDLMTMLSERIPEFYQDEFGEELPGASKFKQLKKDLEQNGSVVANNATTGAILNLSSIGYEVHGDENKNKIGEFVQDQLSQLVEKGEYAKEIKFLTVQEYRQNEFLQIFEDDIDDEEAVSVFNEQLWRVISDRYQTASLDEVLQRVGQKFEDTRPVIIFEDFAITAMEAKRLRNYMERDKIDDNWDFIVAGTRDSTRVLHTQTAEDRFEFYRTNKQNSNSVLFLDEDSAVDFIRPYLGYFKSFDGSVQYDRSGNGLSLDLKPAPAGSICAECGFCDESFRDLYPFNEAFLQRIYSGLNEDEQSPREFVMAVFDVLRTYYEGYVDAPSDADRLNPIRNSIDVATEVYESSESVARLARWYGRPTDQGIEVDARFADVFGFTSTAETIDEVKVTEDYVVVPSSNGRPATGTGGTGRTGETTTGGKTPPKKSQEEQIIDELRPNVQPWQNNLSNFPAITRYLRSALRSAMKYLTNDFELYDGMGLRYNLSSQKDPFVFESLEKAPDQDQIVIDPNEFRISDLRNLLEFGVYYEEDKSKADFGELFRGLGTQLTGYARTWQEKIRSNELESPRRFFKQSADYDFADFALAGYCYVALVDSPSEELSANSLSKRWASEDDYQIDPDLRKELSDELAADDLRKLTEFVNYGDQLEELVEGFFGATGSTLDILAIDQWLTENSPSLVLGGLGRQYISNIAARVRFDTNNKIRDIANKAYDAHGALSTVKTEFEAEVVDEISTELSGLRLREIEETLETLRTYNIADTNMIESLGKFVALDQESIDDTVAAAKLASQLQNKPNERGIQAALISMKLAASDVYTRYSDLTIVGGGGTQGFAEKFLSVGEHYVN